MTERKTFWTGWHERIAALRNVPAVLKIVWASGPSVVIFGLVARLFSALLPVVLLWITKLIIDAIVHAVSAHQPVTTHLWWLVAAEFSVAVLNSVLARTIDYSDSLLADKYTRYVSIRVMNHAASLDLLAYEDPVFYDRLERARVQATDRLVMIQAVGRLVQQAITTITLSVSIMFFSPWLMLLLIVGVVPAFLGESHFAFLGYAKNFKQTPIQRQLDYLRMLGGSKEAAKELKLFGLRNFLSERFTRLSNQIYEENIRLVAAQADCRIFAFGHRNDGVLRGVRVRDLAHGGGGADHWHFDISDRGDSAGEHKYPTDFFDAGCDWRSGAVSHRSAGVLRDAADDSIETQRTACAAADFAGIGVSGCFIQLSRKLAADSGSHQFSFAYRRAARADWGKRAGQNDHCEADYTACTTQPAGRFCSMGSIFGSTTWRICIA